jgi:hypothetical protein
MVCRCGRTHNVSILCTFSKKLSVADALPGNWSEILTTSSSCIPAEPVDGLWRWVLAARGRGRLLGGPRYAKAATIAALRGNTTKDQRTDLDADQRSAVFRCEASKTLQWRFIDVTDCGWTRITPNNGRGLLVRLEIRKRNCEC